MPVLIINVLVLLIALICIPIGGILGEDYGLAIGWVLLGVSLVAFCFGWIPLLGLRVLKPQEALVLTLFGKYVGTLKGEGFYAINPFCGSVNPAANTKLNQSGDVSTKGSEIFVRLAAPIPTGGAPSTNELR